MDFDLDLAKEIYLNCNFQTKKISNTRSQIYKINDFPVLIHIGVKKNSEIIVNVNLENQINIKNFSHDV